MKSELINRESHNFDIPQQESEQEAIPCHPDITESQLSIYFNNEICGFQILPFDNHPFFEKFGKDTFNESIT